MINRNGGLSSRAKGQYDLVNDARRQLFLYGAFLEREVVSFDQLSQELSHPRCLTNPMYQALLSTIRQGHFLYHDNVTEPTEDYADGDDRVIGSLFNFESPILLDEMLLLGVELEEPIQSRGRALEVSKHLYHLGRNLKTEVRKADELEKAINTLTANNRPRRVDYTIF